MSSLRIWISAFRLRTLPLALSAALLGSFLAWDVGEFKWCVLVLALLTTIFLQVLSNLANDYGDAQKGTDSEKRIGPQRVTQSGLVSKRQMRWMIVLFILLSLVAGSMLIWCGTRGHGKLLYILFFLLGLLAIGAALNYTMGRHAYGYSGLGDIMVFIFFGLVGVGGSYYLHTLDMDWQVLLPAASIGLFSAGVLNLNNLRDRDNDRENGKNTLVVILGKNAASVYHMLLLLIGFGLAVLHTVLNFDSWFQFLYILVLPLIISSIIRVFRNEDPADLYGDLKRMALTTLLFSLAFGIGLLI